jgi:hypothetical protein
MTIYEYFGCFTRLPVSVDLVVDVLKDRGFVHEVYFSAVDIPPEVLWAQARFHYPTTPYDRNMPPIVEVMYSKHLDERQARLACCKELLHALDTSDERASTEEAVATLIEQMAIPPNSGISLPAANDHLGVVKALAVLVPEAALAQLRPAYRRGEISEGEIAAALVLPVEYVRITLLDAWDKLVAQFC